MKKAFTLMEVLVVIVTLPIAFFLTSRVLVTLLRDIPSDARLLQQNTSVLNMTQRIAEDMDRAEALPNTAGALSSNAQTLLIQLPQAVVCYQRTDNGFTRSLVGQTTPDHTWQMPDATVAWTRWERDGQAYAVELETHLERRMGQRSLEKFANAHVYFVDGIGKVDEIE